MTALAVLAQWRLLRAWRVPRVTVALLAGIAFLLVDGTSSYGPPGNLFADPAVAGEGDPPLRAWCRCCWSTCCRYVERPPPGARGLAVRLRHRGRRAVDDRDLPGADRGGRRGGSPAPEGRPGRAARLRRHRGLPARRGRGHAGRSTADPPTTSASVGSTASIPSGSATPSSSPGCWRWWPWRRVLVGCLLLPHPAARVTTGVVVLATGLTFVPGFTRLDLRPRRPRPDPVAGHVGAARSPRSSVSSRPGWPAGCRGRGRRGGARSPDWPCWRVRRADLEPRHRHLPREPAALAARRRLARRRPRGCRTSTEPGDVVLAPDGLSITVRGHHDRYQGGGAPRLLPRLPPRRPELPVRRAAHCSPRW